jgi:hypothetical protein
MHSMGQPALAAGHLLPDWLDHDEPGQPFADGKPGIADLADKIRLARQQPDNLVFTKADFAQSILNLGRGAELLDAHRYASPNPIQGANLTPGILPASGLKALCPVLVHGFLFSISRPPLPHIFCLTTPLNCLMRRPPALSQVKLCASLQPGLPARFSHLRLSTRAISARPRNSKRPTLPAFQSPFDS